jgi:hypothetical protein
MSNENDENNKENDALIIDETQLDEQPTVHSGEGVVETENKNVIIEDVKVEKRVKKNLLGEVEQEESEDLLEMLKDTYRGIGSIAVRPYVNPKKENMGLEKYGYVLFPGTHQMEDMACVTFRGKLRYLNGLDEYAASVQGIDDKEKREAKALQIRTIVAQLELEKTFNRIDVKDLDFWNKVDTFRPDNGEVWGSMALKCSNEPIFLDPIKNTDHLLTLLAIENGGYPGIAKSFEDAKSGPRDKKWFLDKQSDTVGTRATSSKLKNQALGILEQLSEENPRKLLFIAKLSEANSIQYHYSTLPSVVYDNMDSFITGKASESVIKKAAGLFLAYSEMDMRELKVRSMIKDATFYKHLITKGDGLIYKKNDNTMLGRNSSEVYEYLINPLNEGVLDSLLTAIEATWIK